MSRVSVIFQLPKGSNGDVALQVMKSLRSKSPEGHCTIIESSATPYYGRVEYESCDIDLKEKIVECFNELSIEVLFPERWSKDSLNYIIGFDEALFPNRESIFPANTTYFYQKGFEYGSFIRKTKK